LIHECFNTVKQLIERSGYPEKSAIGIGTMAHTSPLEAGKVLDLVRPRHAAVFHFFNDFDTGPEVEHEIRQNYQGPLTLAQDLMVFNVTPDQIAVRLAITPTLVWPNKERHEGFRAASRKQRPTMSRWLADKQLFPKF
jgi:ribonuclease Z